MVVFLKKRFRMAGLTLYNMCRYFDQLGIQLERFSTQQADLVRFNEIFSSFLHGLRLQADSLSFGIEEKPSLGHLVRTEEKKIVAPKPREVVKKVGSNLVKKIVQGLPLEIRTKEHIKGLEDVIQALCNNPEGEYVNKLMVETGVVRGKVTQYLNAMVKSKDVVKTNKKGFLYRINPDKHRLH